MKGLNIGALLSVAAIMCAGCQKENGGGAADEGIENFSGYTATILKAEDRTTKTTLDNDNHVAWISGDKVKVIGAGTASGDLTVITANSGAYTGFLSGTMPAVRADGTYMAVYPTGLVTSVADGFPALKLPETRACTNNVAPLQWSPMVAVSEGQNFEFRNVCALLEITVKGTGYLKKIEFLSTDATSSFMSGNLKLGANGAASIVNDADASRKAIVTFSGNVSLTAEGVKFYLALPAGTYKTPILRLFDNSGYISSYKFDNNIVTAAGSAYAMSVSASFHAAVQLWQDGPYFATMNIGAGDVYQPGTFYMWGSHTKIYSADAWTSQATAVGAVTSLPEYPGGFCAATVTSLGLDPYYASATKLTVAAGTDPVNKLWGGGWHTPTVDDWTNFISNCTWTFEAGATGKHPGYNIWIVKGKGAFATATINLPNTSYIYGVQHQVETKRVLLWSNECKNTSGVFGPHSIEINSSGTGTIVLWASASVKTWGWPLRPVTY